MAVNNDNTNKLYAVNDTGVKFFSSLTRALAKGEAKFVYNGEETDINSFPGAICYVSDDKGNSIFLNKLLFGDGAHASSADSTTGGSGGSGGITEVSLDLIPVVTKDGTTLKTLADYFNADGTIISDSLTIYETKDDGNGGTYKQSIIVLDKNGITINSNSVLTSLDLVTINSNIAAAEKNAKDYTDSKLGSIYKVLGSKSTINDLKSVENPEIGWVYNVINGVNNLGDTNYIPPGTNFVWNGTEWDPLGGTIDLSNYKTSLATTTEINTAELNAKDYTDDLVSSINNTIEAHGNSILALNNSYTSLVDLMGINTTNIATNISNIEQNTTNITNISTQLTWQ